MEKTDHAVVVPLDAGWSDIGAWPALWDISVQDERGNVLQGDVFTHATQGALVVAQHRFVCHRRVDNLVVIETPDAVLVMHKTRSSMSARRSSGSSPITAWNTTPIGASIVRGGIMREWTPVTVSR